MRQLPSEIEVPVRNWIDENVPTPEGPPVVDAEVKLDAVHDILIGSLPPGADGPTSGTQTYVIDIRFLVTPETEQLAIDQLLTGLREAAAEEPQIEGLHGGRLLLGEDKIEVPEQHEDPDHDGPIVTLKARAKVQRAG